ncbi:MAG: AIR synthase-related protein [Thermoplasmatota archaeon]
MDDRRSVQLGDGAGGELMQKMLSDVILPRIRGRQLEIGEEDLSADILDDSASVEDWAFTIDGHTIWPLEFPGGDIGSLSVFGTVNDLAVVGAEPVALALSMVIEEGLDLHLLQRIVGSIGKASELSGVGVITGDTKVVERGGVKGMIVTTSGMGKRHPDLDLCLEKAGDLRKEAGSPGMKSRWLRDDSPRPGDAIILTGSVGDHGISLLSFREGYGFETDLISDLAPLNGLIGSAIEAGGIVAAKDLTRGGLANGLNEWARKSGFRIEVSEETIPVKKSVLSACDMLGLDPFEIGNEGKAIICTAPGIEEDILKVLRSHDIGRDSAIIGRVVEGRGDVILETEVGGRRIMDPPYGDPVPRIC